MGKNNIIETKEAMDEVNIRIGNSLSNNMFQFLECFKVTEKDGEHTHCLWTEKHKGKYYIPPKATDKFIKMYKFNLEYDLPLGIVEKHRDISPVVIDLDFKQSTQDRKYDIELTRLFVSTYHSIIKEYVQIGDKPIKYFILEKPAPRPSGNEWKDGLHIVSPDIVTRPLIQHLVRDKFLQQWNTVFEGKEFFTNNKNDVFDESVIERNGWFMYGSKKPNEEHPWTLSTVFTFNGDDMGQDDLHYEQSELVDILSIRNKYQDNELIEGKIEEVEEYEMSRRKKNTPELQEHQNNTTVKNDNQFPIAEALTKLLSAERAHAYETWIKVGWCLRNIDDRLLPSWIEFSKKSDKFVEGECEKYWRYMKKDKLGMGSLHLWAKQDNPTGYAEVVKNDLASCIRKAASGVEFDIALVIKTLYDGLFAFEKDEWFVFDLHRWEKTEKGMALRKKIPTEIANEFRKASNYYNQLAAETQDTEERERLDGLVDALNGVVRKLGKAPFQASVMTECSLLFHQKDFIKNLDEKTNLIGFNNGVFDLETMTFRDGKPEDYLTFTTGYDYTPVVNVNVRNDIMAFFSEVQDNPEVRDYLLLMLAASLDGYKRLELILFWVGAMARNGKSTIAKLLSKSFGDYYYEPSVALFTKKRQTSSGANPEVAKAKGRRILMVSEPERDETFQISTMKNMSGNDLIQARDLFVGFIEFGLQCQIIAMMNNKAGLSDNDMGFRSRLRYISFNNHFCDSPDPKRPFQKKIDKTLKKKFGDNVSYHQEFMLMLLEIYGQWKENNFEVVTPQIIQEDTMKYLDDNNAVGTFISETYDEDDDGLLKVKDMFDAFKRAEPKTTLKLCDFKDQLILNGYLPYKYDKNKPHGYKNIVVVSGLTEKAVLWEDDEYDNNN